MAAASESLWQTILREVSATTASAKALPSKSVVILGDEKVGKSALLHRLQGKKHAGDDGLKGTGLEFSYIDIKEEETEDILSRLTVFLLDGNPEFHNLLDYIITPASLSSTLLVVVLDMSKPWTLGRSLERWLQIVYDHISALHSPQLDELKAKLLSQFVSFTDAPVQPTESEGGAAAAAQENGNADGENGHAGDAEAASEGGSAAAPAGEQVVELEDGVLNRNLGLPVIVVCTKCDATAQLEKDRDFRQEHFDFIQMHLRKICLRYGATLVYHGKDGRTTELVRKCIANRAWGTPALPRANIADRDSIFIPAGWDSPKKISMLHDSFKSFSPSDALEAKITPPAAPKTAVIEAGDVEEEQEFLKRAQQQLGTLGQNGDPTMRSASVSLSSRASFSVSASPSRADSKERLEKSASREPPAEATPVKTSASTNVALSKFFTTLLKAES